MKLFALYEIVIAMGADAVRVPLPVRVRTLEWNADDDVDTDWARETVANAVGLGVLTDATRVCDYANKTVYCVNSTCEVFAGCFPNARLLYLGGRVTSVDLTRCPNIERVRIRDMSPELYTAVLLTAPRIPTRPIAAGVYDWEKSIAEVHAPHLLTQIVSLDGRYKWAPPVHRSFTRTARMKIGVFMMGVMRCMEAGMVTEFDPAMLEDAMREIPLDLLEEDE